MALLLCMSLVRVARFDLEQQPHFRPNDIHVSEFPEPDPWLDDRAASETRSGD